VYKLSVLALLPVHIISLPWLLALQLLPKRLSAVHLQGGGWHRLVQHHAHYSHDLGEVSYLSLLVLQATKYKVLSCVVMRRFC
jgi:hypothetical protein